jgi:integrase
MLHNWCKKCNRQSEVCVAIESHKKDFLWRTDFILDGYRIRKYYRLKEEAVGYESNARSDFQRLKIMPADMQSKLLFKDLATEWYGKYVLIRILNPKTEKSHLDILCAFFGNKPIAGLTLQDGEEFIEKSVKDKKKIGAINRDLSTLKSLTNWAVKNRHLLSNPFKYLNKLKEHQRLPRWLSKEEFNQLLNKAQEIDPPLVDVILFGVYSGFRRGNLQRVTAQDVSRDMVLAKQTKSGIPYHVPISPGFRTLLDRLIREKPTGPLLDTVDIKKRFRNLVKAAGLWKGAFNEETITLHSLRHTFASWAVQSGVDLYKLQRMMGHASVVMTQRYAHLAQQDLIKESSLLNFDVLPKVELKVV